MSRLRNGTNRAALGVLAVALLCGGAALASATEPVGDRLPEGWPRLPADRVWLDASALSRWRGHGWWTPVVIAALALGLLLFLWWAVGQVRTGRLRQLPLGHSGVTLAGPALASAMAERVRSVRGVADAEVSLLGTPRRLRARITLSLTPGLPAGGGAAGTDPGGGRGGEDGGGTARHGGGGPGDRPFRQAATPALSGCGSGGPGSCRGAFPQASPPAGRPGPVTPRSTRPSASSGPPPASPRAGRPS
ncbi:hypothetical protein [Streptomyces flavofungini]|uniref:hypothetical protein n=1 Tax=Streptomyces flavofungini TaxID=68200 RepID=UPI0034DEA57B